MKQRPDPTVFREFIKFSRVLNAIFMQTAPGPAQTAFSQIYRGVPYAVAKEALRLAAQKLPITTKFVVRRDYTEE